MSISSEINRIKDEVETQADLIGQIRSALQGKVAGGGESADPELQSKTVTPTKSTQEVVADSGYDGLEKVTVNPIPSNYIIPSGTKSITTNGTHDVTANASVSVNVPIPEPVLQDITITENGTYTADSGYDGLGTVTVNVPTSSGGGGNSEDLTEVLEEQANLIANLKATLDMKVNVELPLKSFSIEIPNITYTVHCVRMGGVYSFDMNNNSGYIGGEVDPYSLIIIVTNESMNLTHGNAYREVFHSTDRTVHAYQVVSDGNDFNKIEVI